MCPSNCSRRGVAGTVRRFRGALLAPGSHFSLCLGNRGATVGSVRLTKCRLFGGCSYTAYRINRALNNRSCRLVNMGESCFTSHNVRLARRSGKHFGRAQGRHSGRHFGIPNLEGVTLATPCFRSNDVGAVGRTMSCVTGCRVSLGLPRSRLGGVITFLRALAKRCGNGPLAGSGRAGTLWPLSNECGGEVLLAKCPFWFCIVGKLIAERDFFGGRLATFMFDSIRLESRVFYFVIIQRFGRYRSF